MTKKMVSSLGVRRSEFGWNRDDQSPSLFKDSSFGFAGASDSKSAMPKWAWKRLFHAAYGIVRHQFDHGCGLLEYGLTGSLVMLVIGDEIVGMTRKIINGIEVNEERLARV